MSEKHSQNKSSQKESINIDQDLSQVATNPKQSLLIIIAISCIFLYLVYSMFLGSTDNEEKEKQTEIPDQVQRPVSDISDVPSIPKLPQTPKLEDPELLPPPPPIEEEVEKKTEPALPDIQESIEDSSDDLGMPSLPFRGIESDEAKKRKEAKRKSSIMLISGVPPKKTDEELQQELDFKNRGDMNLILGRGKMIDAVIETAVNTDFGGEIRAVVSRDVYSEWGKNILVPKGSRVYGNYATGIEGTYGRVSIIWNRINLANGYTLNLSGTGIDALGRRGNQGRVDNKFKERLSNAVFKSAINIALAKVLDDIVKPQINSESAANQTQIAKNIKDIADSIIIGGGDPDAQRTEICTRVLASISDKTSTLYTNINATCEAQKSSNGTPQQKLLAVLSSITSAGNSSLTDVANNSIETKEQEASKKAFEDISNVLRKIVEEQQFKPTITIDQGTPVKIYVNRDYKFPQKAINDR